MQRRDALDEREDKPGAGFGAVDSARSGVLADVERLREAIDGFWGECGAGVFDDERDAVRFGGNGQLDLSRIHVGADRGQEQVRDEGSQ